MKTKIFFSVIIASIIIVSNVVTAQKNAIIKFDTLIHNFGKIKEEGGKVTTTFEYKNTGTDTLKLFNVKPGCGCTTADWTKDPILPGQKSYIKTEFDPKGRPGVFAKAITVTSNATEPSIMLIIKGDVTPRPKTIADSFPVVSGNLLMKTNHMAFMEIKNNIIRTDTLDIYNNWNKSMTFSFADVPVFLSCKAVPQTLAPAKKGFIIVTYDAAKKKDFGLVYDYITVLTNDTTEAKKQITVSANIIEDFSNLTPQQKKDAPKIVFTSESYDFGTAIEGDIVKFSFEFKNNGNDDLIIRKTKASCGCTASTPEKITLKKGESSKIDIQFNSAGKKGEQHKTITVISNDPDKSNVTLNIKGTVTTK
jgi:hypothetical protein